jgi:hypothetical protein
MAMEKSVRKNASKRAFKIAKMIAPTTQAMKQP